jgi:hypothetical protein
MKKSKGVEPIRRSLKIIEETAAELDEIFRRAALRRPGEVVITKAEQKAFTEAATLLCNELGRFADAANSTVTSVEG